MTSNCHVDSPFQTPGQVTQGNFESSVLAPLPPALPQVLPLHHMPWKQWNFESSVLAPLPPALPWVLPLHHMPWKSGCWEGARRPVRMAVVGPKLASILSLVNHGKTTGNDGTMAIPWPFEVQLLGVAANGPLDRRWTLVQIYANTKCFWWPRGNRCQSCDAKILDEAATVVTLKD